MVERLSDSEKEKLKEKLRQSGQSSSYLLEKLANEIASNFGNKKNPGIYKESIKSLLKLKKNINSKNDIFKLKEELKNLSAHLSEEKKQEFILAIEGAKEILKNSRQLIDEIKNNIDNNIFTPKDGKFTTKLFGQNLLKRGKNPKNISDQLIGGGIGLFNSGEAIAKISVKLLIGIGKTIPDIYKIISGKANYDGFKDI